MDKKYEVVWRDPQKTVLMVNYLQDVTWEDVLAADIEAVAVIQQESHSVSLFHYAGKNNINLTDIGSIKELLYNKVPFPPPNMKLVIVLLNNFRAKTSLKVAMGVLDKVIFRRKLTYVVDTVEEAERLILQASSRE